MKKKKGFTLVELLVVIAILAVLATVSVVGYMGFTKKAHESNDIGLTTQMNTILQAEEVTNKPTTPHEAVKQLANGGVDVEKLTPTTDGYNYVYDLDANRMFLLDDNRAVVAPTNIEYTADLNVFAFVGSENEITNWNGYSVYLKSGFTFNNSKTLTLSTGLDVGDNEVDTINYERKNVTNKQTVLIRTTDGLLNIDAEKDTINHYGISQEVNIEKVSNNNCYHEYGSVSNVLLKYGKFVSHANSRVNTLNLLEADEENVDVTINEGVVLTIKANDNIKNKITGSLKPSSEGFIDNDVEAVITNSLGNKVITKGTFNNIINSLSESGQIIVLMKNIAIDNLLTTIDTTIDFNGYKLNINNNSSYGFVSERKLNIKNGEIYFNSERGLNAKGFLNIDNMTIKGKEDSIVAVSVNASANINNSYLEIGGYVISSFANNNLINIHNSRIISLDNSCSLYHNGSYKGFEVNVYNSMFNGLVYISASKNTAYQKALFNDCTINGKSGIEVKYTNLTLNNCKVTATDEPSFTFNNNGATTNGMAVVSSDNTMDGTPAPDGVIEINGGEYIGLVGLKDLIGKEYPNLKEVTYIIKNALINGKIINR